ncbi:hypothetical protein AB0I77_18970 [Streptomyces sp. NPDC050619]|uniref:hypothetical protein n=1 Tax=Streptomyces sp. NPDC050619 TaxID=3157214 RepID=UPI003415B5A0
MGSARVTLRAGFLAAATTAVTALAPTAPAAYAQDGGVSVSPSSPAPGSDVTLRVSGCTEKTARAVSEAFVADVRLTVSGTDGMLVGPSRVRTSLEPGTYTVKVTCGDGDFKGALTVVAKSAHGAERPTVHASPVAPVRAGGGGTARLAAADDDARATGPGTGHTVTGLVLAGAAAVAIVLRRTRRGRATD